MITFQIRNINRAYQDEKLLGNVHLDSISNIQCDFEINIDNGKSLSFSQFNLVEFIEQLLKWKLNGFKNSFSYDCMDSEENLFDLNKEGSFYRVFSSYYETETFRLLTKSEICDFINRLKHETIKKVKQRFSLDLMELKIII